MSNENPMLFSVICIVVLAIVLIAICLAIAATI